VAGAPHHQHATLQPHGHAKPYWQVVKESGGFVPDLCKPEGMIKARSAMGIFSVFAKEYTRKRVLRQDREK
jgi:hypothetical protein